MMIFNLSKVFFALAAVGAATASAVPQKRQAELAVCDFVLTPIVAVDPSTNFVAEFNYVLGRSLAIETGSTILNGGATFTENGSSFNVHNELEVEGKTGAETAAILEGWVGETKEGLAANWVIDSVTCA